VGLARLILRRFSKLVTKRPLGLSIDRDMTMSREVSEDYFELLLYVLKENNLLDKAGLISYVHESDFHMNPELETIIAEKGCTKRRQYLC
jgi:hypothetical protein